VATLIGFSRVRATERGEEFVRCVSRRSTSQSPHATNECVSGSPSQALSSLADPRRSTARAPPSVATPAQLRPEASRALGPGNRAVFHR
jgi:hypothetical protein